MNLEQAKRAEAQAIQYVKDAERDKQIAGDACQAAGYYDELDNWVCPAHLAAAFRGAKEDLKRVQKMRENATKRVYKLLQQ